MSLVQLGVLEPHLNLVYLKMCTVHSTQYPLPNPRNYILRLFHAYAKPFEHRYACINLIYSMTYARCIAFHSNIWEPSCKKTQTSI